MDLIITGIICAAIGVSLGAVGMGAIVEAKIDAYRTGLKRAQATADYEHEQAMGFAEALSETMEYAASLEAAAKARRKAGAA